MHFCLRFTVTPFCLRFTLFTVTPSYTTPLLLLVRCAPPLKFRSRGRGAERILISLISVHVFFHVLHNPQSLVTAESTNLISGIMYSTCTGLGPFAFAWFPFLVECISALCTMDLRTASFWRYATCRCVELYSTSLLCWTGVVWYGIKRSSSWNRASFPGPMWYTW